jgi:dTDP-4-dehydrorhamnose reductase
MTKNLGEICDNSALTIRTSIIGPELKEDGEGLFHWVHTQRQKEYINGYDKTIWSGVTTLELAKAIEKLIEHDVTGLFQLTNGEKISKYELLILIVQQFEWKIAICRIDGIVNDKSILPSFKENLQYFVPSYQEMMKELYDFMCVNKTIYKQYFLFSVR